MKKKLSLLISALMAVCVLVPAISACGPNNEIPPHEHRIYPVEAVEETCSSEGNIAYDECIYCRQKFVNGKEVSDEAVILPVSNAKHNLTFVPGIAATCRRTGTKEYYKCSICDKMFSDETCAEQITDLELPLAPHNVKQIAAGEATCYSQAHIAHYVCETCGALLKTNDANSDDRYSYEEVYTGSTLAHNFDANGVCTNANCGAKRVDRKIVAGETTVCSNTANTVTNAVKATPGSWNGFKYNSGAITMVAEEDIYKMTLSSNSSADRYLRLCSIPAKDDGTQYVGVYKLSFDFKVTKYHEQDTVERSLKFGFSLRSAAGTSKGDFFDIPSVKHKVGLDTVYHFELLVETNDINQILQIEIANIPCGPTKFDKSFEINNMSYVFYSDAAKTYTTRIEVTMPENLGTGNGAVTQANVAAVVSNEAILPEKKGKSAE